jgi:hypothetical protein
MEISKEKAVELGIVTEYELQFGIEIEPEKRTPVSKIFISQEFLQDMYVVEQQRKWIRVPIISEEEIAEWHEVNKQLDTINLEEARKRVVFIKKDKL